MSSVTLTDHQLALVGCPVERKIFLEGPAGSGKTTAGVGRLLHLLAEGVPARSILVVVPQRTLAAPYYEALRRPTVEAGGQVTILTIGGLARRMVDLFWPVVAEGAGFAHPDRPPTFLTLETAQYYMARLARPLLDQGFFETVTIDRNRLYSQILDNLNKAAVVGFPHTEIGARLEAAWGGEESQKRIYDEAQICANRFREHCLAHNLLDFSLQVELFVNTLWTLPLCRDYLLETYTHLVVDNVEEDTPVAHDLLREWLPCCRSALVVYDQEAGYRRFLAADPESGYALKELCSEQVAFVESHVASSDLQSLGYQLARSLTRLGVTDGLGDVRTILTYKFHRYHPEMLDWVAAEIAGLVHVQGVPPGEIAVLAPFLTDALRFSLTNRLQQHDVPARSHRPSRALREEPAARCLLTLAAIAHPQWGICPSRFDVAYALMQAVEGMDLVRAQLLAEIVYRVREGVSALSSFDLIKTEVQERLTFALGERYEVLRGWIADYTVGLPVELDHFLGRLFGELLSQQGYGFHRNYDAGQVAANLVESVRKFRWVVGPVRGLEVGDGEIVAGRDDVAAGGDPRETCEEALLGKEYVEMVRDGVVAAQYLRSWQLQLEDAVLLAPAYTFLMANRPVDVQFWLDIGSRGWWERLYQPLTHPYVLSRHWPREALWTDADEFEARQSALCYLTLGLTRRCRRKIYLGLSELGEQGYEQRGPLLQAVQRILRHVQQASHYADDVQASS